MGYCEGYDVSKWHERCPEEWQKDVWRLAHKDRKEGRKQREKKKKEEMEKKGKGRNEADYDSWASDEPFDIGL